MQLLSVTDSTRDKHYQILIEVISLHTHGCIYIYLDCMCVNRTHSWSKSPSKTKRLGGISTSRLLDRSLRAETNPHRFPKNTRSRQILMTTLSIWQENTELQEQSVLGNIYSLYYNHLLSCGLHVRMMTMIVAAEHRVCTAVSSADDTCVYTAHYCRWRTNRNKSVLDVWEFY